MYFRLSTIFNKVLISQKQNFFFLLVLAIKRDYEMSFKLYNMKTATSGMRNLDILLNNVPICFVITLVNIHNKFTTKMLDFVVSETV